MAGEQFACGLLVDQVPNRSEERSDERLGRGRKPATVSMTRAPGREAHVPLLSDLVDGCCALDRVPGC